MNSLTGNTTGKDPHPDTFGVPGLLNPQNSASRRIRGLRSCLVLLTVISAFLDGAVNAQQVFIPPPTIPDEPELAPLEPDLDVFEESETNQPARVIIQETSPPPLTPLPERQPFQWRFLTLRPHVSHTVTYGTGVQSSPGREEKTFVNEFSPGITLDLGEKWTVDYTAGFAFYSDDDFRDTINHSVNLTGGAAYRDWLFRLFQQCSLISEPLAETGSQTDQEAYSTSLGASHQINSRLSVELGLAQSLRFTERFQDSAIWSTTDWLNYHWSPALAAGIGIGFGYTEVVGGTDMTHEQLKGRVTLRLTRKINLSINGGAEVRQFLGSDSSDLVSPVFGASITYQPFEVTTISLQASQSIAPSYFQNQITERTGFDINIRQRVFKRFYAGLSGGYSQTSYRASAGGVTVGREDDHGFLRVSLGTRIVKRGYATVFYSTSRNSSDSQEFGYSSEQIGLSLSYAY